MVSDPGKYKWSSYQTNTLVNEYALCMPHQEYLALGADPEERRNTYHILCTQQIDQELLSEIRAKTNTGLALASDRFKTEIEELTGRRVAAKKRGRPLGWRKEHV